MLGSYFSSGIEGPMHIETPESGLPAFKAGRATPVFVKLLLLFTLVSGSASLRAANPTVPENLRSSIYSATAGELFWDASSDADSVISYRVYISGALYREVPGTSLFIDVMHPGQRYDFQVSAVDGMGNESRWTSVHSVHTGEVGAGSSAATNVSESAEQNITGPSVQSEQESAVATILAIKPPVAITVVMQTDDSVAVEWQAAPTSAAVAGYNVYLGNSYIATSSSAAFELRGLDADSSYRLILTAFDFDGNFSSKSEVVVISTLPQGAVNVGPAVMLGAVDTTADEDNTAEELTVVEEVAPAGSSATEDAVVAEASDVVPEAEATATVMTAESVENPQPLETENAEEEMDIAAVTTDSPDSIDDSDIATDELETETDTATTETEAIAELAEPEVTSSAVMEVDNPGEAEAPLELVEATVVDEIDVDFIDSGDFFGRALEIDNEEAQPGAAPTTPKNLHANLISNDWVELNWAPSNDDGEVVEYRIHRDDGVVYSIAAADESGDVETNKTLMNFWKTTTYVDCNYTHVQACSDTRSTPEVGALHTYQVSAVDDEGNESSMSEPLTVQMHERQGAIIEPFVDPYLDGNDDFLFVTDLSDTANFIDQFDLIFSDEFEGDSIDPAKWSTSLTWNQEGQNIINGEMQYFIDTQRDPEFGYDPFIFNGETLTIAAIETPPELLEKAKGQPYLSGALSTHETRSGQLDSDGNYIADKFATTYGYVEGRIRVGQISGMLTSFYLFRRWSGEHAPEIDIIEYLGENPYGDEKAFQTYHYQDVSHEEILSSPTMQFPPGDGSLGDFLDLDGFHTYSVLWEPGLVIWYIDGMEVQRLTGRQVGRQSMNIILYLVAGSAWAPKPADDAPFPLEIEVDYVRAYKRKPWQAPVNDG